MDNKTELLRKLKALADGGTQNERLVAQRKLNELMAKYKVTECELDDEEKREFCFKYSSDIERRMLQQTIFKVTNSPPYIYTYKVGNKREAKKVYALCTKSQAIEIDFLFDFYKRTWKKEMELFFLRVYSKASHFR